MSHACLVAFAENEALEASEGEQRTAGGNVSTILTGQFWHRKLPSLRVSLSISFGSVSLLVVPTSIAMAVSSRSFLPSGSRDFSWTWKPYALP